MTLLGTLKKGAKGVIRSVGAKAGDAASQKLCARLLEMGLVEGSFIEVKHEAPLGDPIAIQVRGSLLGLRREEALLVDVELEGCPE